MHSDNVTCFIYAIHSLIASRVVSFIGPFCLLVLISVHVMPHTRSALIILRFFHSVYSSTCHERTPSGPGKSVRTLQVAAHQRDE